MVYEKPSQLLYKNNIKSPIRRDADKECLEQQALLGLVGDTAGTLGREETVGGAEASATFGNGDSATDESTGAGARAGGMLAGGMAPSIAPGTERYIGY